MNENSLISIIVYSGVALQLLGPFVLSIIFKAQYGVYLWPFVLPF